MVKWWAGWHSISPFILSSYMVRFQQSITLDFGHSMCVPFCATPPPLYYTNTILYLSVSSMHSVVGRLLFHVVNHHYNDWYISLLLEVRLWHWWNGVWFGISAIYVFSYSIYDIHIIAQITVYFGAEHLLASYYCHGVLRKTTSLYVLFMHTRRTSECLIFNLIRLSADRFIGFNRFQAIPLSYLSSLSQCFTSCTFLFFSKKKTQCLLWMCLTYFSS